MCNAVAVICTKFDVFSTSLHPLDSHLIDSCHLWVSSGIHRLNSSIKWIELNMKMLQDHLPTAQFTVYDVTDSTRFEVRVASRVVTPVQHMQHQFISQLSGVIVTSTSVFTHSLQPACYWTALSTTGRKSTVMSKHLRGSELTEY